MSTNTSSPQEAAAEWMDSEALIYGTDVISLKLRSKGTFKVTCYIEGRGITEITNKGITDDVTVIDGNNLRLIKPTTEIYFSREQFLKLGFEAQEAKIRQLPALSSKPDKGEISGIHVKELSVIVAAAATAIQPEEEKKAG